MGGEPLNLRVRCGCFPSTPSPTGFFSVAQTLQSDGGLAGALDHQFQRAAHRTDIAGQCRQQQVTLAFIFGNGCLLDAQSFGELDLCQGFGFAQFLKRQVFGVCRRAASVSIPARRAGSRLASLS